MTETGPVSYGCPREPHLLHVMESAYIAEVIDPGNHRRVAPGDIGELVLTTLGRTGSPLLRYRTGDLVRPARSLPCACGSWELGLEGGILGRGDDMVVVRGSEPLPRRGGSGDPWLPRSCGVPGGSRPSGNPLRVEGPGRGLLRVCGRPEAGKAAGDRPAVGIRFAHTGVHCAPGVLASARVQGQPMGANSRIGMDP